MSSPPSAPSRSHGAHRSSVSPPTTTTASGICTATTTTAGSNGFAAALRHLASHATINHADTGDLT